MPSLRPRTARWSVALGAIGTVVATSLAVPAIAPPVSAAPPIVDDAAIELAIDGFYSYLFRNAEVDPIVEPCPMLTPEQLGWYTQQWNVIPSMQGYVIDAGKNSDLGDNISLFCGVDLDLVAASPDPAAPFGIGLEVSYLLGPTSLESVLAADEATVLVPSVAKVGGVLGGWCGSGANAVCLLRWARNELLISFAVIGPPSGVQQQAMVDMFSAMLPEMIANLGAAYQETSGPTTLPALPPLPQDQPTIPATTVAASPVTTAATTVAPPPVTTAAPPATTVTPTVPPLPATTAAVTTTLAPMPTPTVPPLPATTAAPMPTTPAETLPVPTVPPPTAPPPAPPTSATQTSSTPSSSPSTGDGGGTSTPADSVTSDGSDVEVPGSSDVEVTGSSDVADSRPGSDGPDGLPDGAYVEGAAKIPAGTAGEVTIVMQSAPDGGSVAFVVRNDTDAPVYDIQISGVARDGDGTLVGTGNGSATPRQIPAGGWAMGEIRFGYDKLAGDEEIELAVTGIDTDQGSDSTMLTVTEAAFSAGGYTDEVVGIAENESAAEVSYARASVACFDGSELTGVFSGYGDVDDVAAGSTTPFSVNISTDVVCTSWVTIVEG